jgi:hypothetical protein
MDRTELIQPGPAEALAALLGAPLPAASAMATRGAVPAIGPTPRL